MNGASVQGVEAGFGEGARPVVLALSNPDSVAECTAEAVYDWSEGKVVYASGTAFPPFKRRDGRTYVPSQANNSLIFPGEHTAAYTESFNQVSCCQRDLWDRSMQIVEQRCFACVG